VAENHTASGSRIDFAMLRLVCVCARARLYVSERRGQRIDRATEYDPPRTIPRFIIVIVIIHQLSFLLRPILEERARITSLRG